MSTKRRRPVQAKRRMSVKNILVMAACLALVAVVSVGGTIAWLTATTDPVTNTFTVGDINITLTETPNYDSDGNNTLDSWQAKLIPGSEYAKDPVVTVTANSEDCYLFVKFEEIGNPSTYLTYTSTLTVDEGWTQGDGTNIPANVWYRKVFMSNSDQSWNLLAGNKVTVKNTLDKETIKTIPSQVKITYTAYAVQTANIADAATAWAKITTP